MKKKNTKFLAWVKSFAMNCPQSEKSSANWMLHDNFRGLACIERRYDESNHFVDWLVGFVVDGIFTATPIPIPFPKNLFCYQNKSWGEISGDVWVEIGPDEPQELNPYEQLQKLGYKHQEIMAIMNKSW